MLFVSDPVTVLKKRCDRFEYDTLLTNCGFRVGFVSIYSFFCYTLHSFIILFIHSLTSSLTHTVTYTNVYLLFTHHAVLD